MNASPHAPASARLRKARHAGECQMLLQLPNVGPALAADLQLLGIVHPRELAACEGFELYQRLCLLTRQRHDPCVLDTLLAVTDFMRGAPARPWWSYTAERKATFGSV